MLTCHIFSLTCTLFTSKQSTQTRLCTNCLKRRHNFLTGQLNNNNNCSLDITLLPRLPQDIGCFTTYQMYVRLRLLHDRVTVRFVIMQY